MLDHFFKYLTLEQIKEFRPDLLYLFIYVIANTGARKSFLAQAVGHAVCLSGKESLFAPVNILFPDLECAENTGSLLKLLQKIAKVELLILDDFALRAYSHAEATLLYQILEDRYQKGSKVVTSPAIHLKTL